jgi:hypothetical protein
MTENRQHLAECFLREAVFQSRTRQAAGVALGGSSSPAKKEDQIEGASPCGLGPKAILNLHLSKRAEELFRSLWQRDVAPTELDRIQAVMAGWIEAQDALDRKRNHFLRDFRQANGFDRTTYSLEQAQAFEDGLGRVNNDINTRLAQSAAKLLEV